MGLADSLLLLPAAADLEITNQYNSSTRTLYSSIQCTFLTPLNGTYKLVVLLTEDSVIAPQKDPGLVRDYAHRYMLRDGITGSWGDTLFTGEAPLSVTKHYTYTLPSHFKGRAPNENSCRVVAYIYNASNYEIIQVEERKIKQ